jgi:hypothetical protein
MFHTKLYGNICFTTILWRWKTSLAWCSNSPIIRPPHLQWKGGLIREVTSLDGNSSWWTAVLRPKTVKTLWHIHNVTNLFSLLEKGSCVGKMVNKIMFCFYLPVLITKLLLVEWFYHVIKEMWYANYLLLIHKQRRYFVIFLTYLNIHT